ncbi:hypothetical protein DsansV1_C28g0206141 [Dioscorea sansibarensis]
MGLRLLSFGKLHAPSCLLVVRNLIPNSLPFQSGFSFLFLF